MPLESDHSVVIVTGGGAGLGREICRQLRQRNWAVAVADRDGRAAEETVSLYDKNANSMVAVVADLGTATGPVEMVESTIARFGQLDVLINCAAFATAEAFLEMTAKSWEQTLLVNVRGIALATAAAARAMIPRRRGRILNVTSPASRMSLPVYTAYAASKAAVDSLTRSSAVALAPYQIQVNGIAPGMMDTEMQLKTEAQFATLEGQTDLEAFCANRTARIPLGRRTTVEEVASACVWLVADAPAYITAERLNISGGLDKD